MTATTDTAEHPEIEEIAELSEGLLPAARTAVLTTHLAGCAECAEVYVSLEEIRGLLGNLPTPEPMPAAVVERLEAALAAESSRPTSDSAHTAPRKDATNARDVPDVRPAPDAPDKGDDGTNGRDALGSLDTLDAFGGRERAERRPHPSTPPRTAPGDVSRETSTRGTTPRSSRHPGGSSGPGRPTGNSSAHRRRQRLVLGGAAAAAALGLGSLLFSALDGDKGTPTASPSTQAPAFSGQPLQAHVAELLNGPATRTAEAGSSSPGLGGKSSPRDSPGQESTGNSPLLSETPKVPQCVAKGIGRAEPALAVEQGTYHGDRAYLVVLPHTSDSSKVAAYVVDASCVRQRTAAPGKVLLTTSYARP